MKKILSIMLALVLMLSMATVAFATENDEDPTTPSGTTETDYTKYLDKDPSVPKKYVISHGTAPAETFIFKFEGVSYKNGDGVEVADADIPAIGNVTIAYEEAVSATLSKDGIASIDVEDYELGVYTYKVTEVAPTTKTAGVDYSTEELYLVLTILRDETSGKHYVAAMHYENAAGKDKSTGFTNTYDSGSLTVSKKIQGNMANMDKKFTFTITLTPQDGTEIKSEITSTSEGGKWSDDKLTYTVELGHDESVTLSNIPAGTTYTVTENAENYTSDNGVFGDKNKTIAGGDTDTVTFTNTLTSAIDTGVVLDSLPYILMLAVVGVGMVLFFSKKRRA